MLVGSFVYPRFKSKISMYQPRIFKFLCVLIKENYVIILIFDSVQNINVLCNK